MSSVNQYPDIARSMREPATVPYIIYEKLHNFRALSVPGVQKLSPVPAGPNQSQPDIPCSMVTIISSWINGPYTTVYIGGQELGLAGTSAGGVPVGNGLELDPGRGVMFSVDEFDDEPIREAQGMPDSRLRKLRAINLRDIYHFCPTGIAFLNVLYIQRGI